MDITVSKKYRCLFFVELSLSFVCLHSLFICLIVSKGCVLFGRQRMAERARERDSKPEIPQEGIQNAFECSLSETRV